jgi:hypothetical protein
MRTFGLAWCALVSIACGAASPHTNVSDRRAHACARIEARTNEEVAPLIAALSGPVLAQPELAGVVQRTYGRCDRGWALVLDELSVSEPSPPAGDRNWIEWSGHAELSAVFVDLEGHEHVLSLGALRFASEAPGDNHGWDFGAAVLAHVVDLDGDEVDEAYVRVDRPDSIRWLVLARQGDGIAPITMPETRAITDARDIDGDGLYDLIAVDSFAVALDCSGETRRPQYFGLERVLHARPDRTFDDRDAAAIGFVAAQCASIERGAIVPEDCSSEEVILRIACERYRGASAEEVAAQIEREAPDGQLCEDCLDRDALLSIAREEPRFSLPD